MSAKAIKAALKAAKSCIEGGDFDGAKNHCMKVLQDDSSNYHANVFLGLALLNLNEARDAEAAYKKAISANKDDPLARQGLVNLYEKTWQVAEYIEASKELAICFMSKDERDRCHTVVQKLVNLAQERGTKPQYIDALDFILPGSPVCDYLEGIIPNAADTYLKKAELVEIEEKETINKEVAARRSRLGAVAGKVNLEVRREVYKKSPLEEIYQNIINWSHDTDVRRTTETKLITHSYNKLLVLPAGEKKAQREKVLEWCRGVVVLKYPFELAWKLCFEWKDVESLGELDASLLREYIDIFPEKGLSRSLRAYLDCEISPFPPLAEDQEGNETGGDHEEDSSESEGGGGGGGGGSGGVSLIPKIGPDERLDYMIDGLEKSKSSVLCHRILGEYYVFLKEYENAVDVCRKGLKQLSAEENASGLSFQKNSDAISVTLATALVHYRAPKHHPEASTLFSDVLGRNPRNSGALVGQGLILEEAGDYEGAFDSLNSALDKDPGNPYIASEAAWCNVLLKNYDAGRVQLEECLDNIAGSDARYKDLKALTLWRIGTAMWESDIEGRSDRTKGFEYFMQALRSNPSFAPAYTSLGVFYQDIGDAERASKCFQKAFELSAGEFEAAERLARAFAKEGEWEVVEIVARRAADAEKKRTTPGRAATWPQVAIGVAELNAQNFPQAIQAFQSALRNHPEDFHSWVGLGEAYSSSGRYIAATKCFNQARNLQDNNWFVLYMLSNVQKELGEYDEACNGYREVLQTRSEEFGVLLALSETLVTAAWHYLQTGYYGKAADAAVECIEVASKIVTIRPEAFNLWKTIGDACTVFSWIQQSLDLFPTKLVKTILTTNIDIKEFDILHEEENVGSKELEGFEDLSPLTQCLYGAILSYKRGIYSTLDDKYAHAVAWYNVGCAIYRAFVVEEGEKNTNLRSSAMRCFRRSIKLENRNSEFWNAFGVCVSEIDPRASQHAFVRALHIDERNPRTWTNLGVHYLVYEDYDLANQAFSKAQSADPEYSHAWIGQGLVAAMYGDLLESQELFEHAFKISESFSSIIKRKYANASFEMMIKSHSGHLMDKLFGPIFALRKLEQQTLDDPYVLHLTALYCERIGDFEGAVKRLLSVCNKVEQIYEESESAEVLERFARAKADLARAYLGKKDYESAIENASTALDLSEDNDTLTKCRLSAHLTAGLANYFSGSMDDSLAMFKAALTESNENPDVICLLVQVLWAKGGEEERDVAREQLLSCMEAHPEHIASTMLLAVIGTLDDDKEIIDTVFEEILAMRGKASLSEAQRNRVDKLVRSMAELSSNEDSIRNAYTSAIFLRPSSSITWGALARATGEKHPANMALKLAQQSKSASPEELSLAHAGIGTIENDQMAIYFAPWLRHGWEALTDDVSAAASLTTELKENFEAMNISEKPKPSFWD